MSLVVRLSVNLKPIGWLEILRQEHYQGEPPADSMNTYEVRRDGKLMGTLKHRYGNGAWSLAMKACMLVDALDREDQEP